MPEINTKNNQKNCITNSRQNQSDNEVLSIVACGDIGLYGNLGKKQLREGASAILGDTIDILNRADLVFGNLEGPVSDMGNRHSLPPPYPALRMNPDAISFLKEAGFDVLSISNNHMLDYGPEALLDTIRRLENANIDFFGAGENEIFAWSPKIIEVKGVFIGFIGAHEGGAPAGKDSPGASLFNKKRMVNAIRGIRKRVDFVVVSLHFGFDYFSCPSPYHICLCRQLIDNGADLVLGHHPHVPQVIEKYNNGLIAYSLGNFAFYIGDKSPKQPVYGFMLKIDLDRSEIVDYQIIPYKVGVNLSLSLCKGNEFDDIIKKYKILSKDVCETKIYKKHWYKDIRNFYLGTIYYYYELDIKRGKIISFILHISRLLKPSKTNLIKLKSLIYFIFTGYFLKEEVDRLINKLR